jgi:hypothetical protein
LFSYQKNLCDSSGPEKSTILLSLLGEYLDKSDYTRILESDNYDAIDILENFGEILFESHLIQSYEVLRTRGGLRFVVGGCVFAKKVHGSLDPRGVTCPYGMIACALIEHKYGKSVASALSTFTQYDSETDIKLTSSNSVEEDLLSWVGTTPEGVET